MDIEEQVAQANRRLKQAKIGIIIWKRGDKLSLRGMLPPKPGWQKTNSSQQTIALDIFANPAGIKRAEAEARKVGGQLACKEFSWDLYLKNPAEPTATVAQWIEKFKKDYFTRRSRTPKSETTWRTEYQTFFNTLPQDEHLTSCLLLQSIKSTEPDSRSRQRFCMVAKQLAKFAEIDFDPSPLAGSYSPRQVTPRDIPTDEEIANWYERIPDTHGWQYAFGLMATYGLRNHEVFNLDLESLTKSPGIVTVLDGKTGRRRVWPCYPEWYEKWHLWEIERIPKVTGKDNSALGMRMTQALKRYGFTKPYNLRHAWAVRTLEFGLDVSLAAAQMGHSIQVHTGIYHHWINDRHHQRAFELLMQRTDRPLAP
jgi:integrase